MKNIAIIGPESSGKTTLSRALSSYFEGVLIEEKARAYLSKIDREYNYEDVEQIAKSQWESILKHKDSTEWMFCDTELWVIELWTQEVFQKTIPWVKENLNKQPFDLYLLCYPDLQWQPDPLREAPELETRVQYFEWFKDRLEEDDIPFKVIKGDNDRKGQAINHINSL